MASISHNDASILESTAAVLGFPQHQIVSSGCLSGLQFGAYMLEQVAS